MIYSESPVLTFWLSISNSIPSNYKWRQTIRSLSHINHYFSGDIYQNKQTHSSLPDSMFSQWFSHPGVHHHNNNSCSSSLICNMDTIGVDSEGRDGMKATWLRHQRLESLVRSVPVLARTVTWTGCQARDTWRDGQNLGQIGGSWDNLGRIWDVRHGGQTVIGGQEKCTT